MAAPRLEQPRPAKTRPDQQGRKHLKALATHCKTKSMTIQNSMNPWISKEPPTPKFGLVKRFRNLKIFASPNFGVGGVLWISWFCLKSKLFQNSFQNWLFYFWNNMRFCSKTMSNQHNSTPFVGHIQGPTGVRHGYPTRGFTIIDGHLFKNFVGFQKKNPTSPNTMLLSVCRILFNIF